MTTHLSTRLVWHDRAWDGHVCDHPSKNAYCMVHGHIRDGRDDEPEDEAAGMPLSELDGWQPPAPAIRLPSRLAASRSRTTILWNSAIAVGQRGNAPVFRLPVALPLAARGELPRDLRG